MRIAYFTNQYPSVSHTFIRREIAALEERGIEVQRFSIRPPPVQLVDRRTSQSRPAPRCSWPGASPAGVAAIALAFVGLGVAMGWARYGRKAVPFRYLLLVPLYVIWKIPLYVSFLFGRRKRQWRRTER